MRHNLKRIGNKTLAVVLSVMMVISTLLVGIVTVDAANGSITVYFKNTVGWNNVYAYFYNGPYWNSEKGSGSMNIAGGPVEMTKVDGEENIYMCTYTGDYSSYISFTESQQPNYENFYNTSAAYRADFNPSSSLFTPDTSSSGFYNNTTYYSNGNWSTYSPEPAETHYYIGGRFRVKDANGDYQYTYDSDLWGPDATNIELTDDDSDGIYTLNTNCTIAELSETVQGTSEMLPLYFFIHTGNGISDNWYGETGAVLDDDRNSVTLATQVAGTSTDDAHGLVRFNGTSQDGNVVLKFNPETRELSYELWGVGEQYAVNIGTQDNCTISVNPESAYEGQTVTVKVTPNDGYVCTGVTVDPATEVSGSGNTYTFKMPANAVTVSATTRVADTYSVTASANDESMGSVSVEPSTTVTEGNPVTLIATSNPGYDFKGWEVVNGTYNGDLTSSTITFIPTDDVEFKANFEESVGEETGVYLLVSTKSNRPSDWNGDALLVVPVYNVSGKYTAYLEQSFSSNINYYFALSSTQDINGMYSVTGIQYSINGSISAYSQNYFENGRNYNFSYFRVSNPNVTKITFDFSSIDEGASDLTYTLTATEDITPDDPTKVTVNAKDGTVVDNLATTSDYGATTLLSGYDEIISDNPAVHYSVYTATKGNMIRIQTAVAPSYHEAGYYVAAYVINGVTVAAASQGNGKYEASYLLSESMTSKSLEITPVYYNTNIEKNDDYITFYVDASEVLNDEYAAKLAGNTLATYTYYYTGGTGADGDPNANEGDGAYPGQPMLRDNNGKYYTKVAKYYYDANGEKTEYKISGVVVSNYSNDKLHNQFMVAEGKANAQTYDYDDLVQIDRNDYDVVEFKMQYSKNRTNQNILLHDATNNPDVAPTVDLSQFTANNGWDMIVDYDGNATSLLGNLLTEEDMAKDELRIVSVGNQNIEGHGVWSTVWYVYDKYGNYITRGVPSDFLPRLSDSDENTAAYQAIEAAGYANSPAYVSFESISGVDSRVDGQWFYSKSVEEVTGNTIVQYADSSDSSDWTPDADGTTGNTATIAGETSVTVTRNTSVELSATPGNGYMFVEWGYLDADGNYKAFSVNANQQVTDVILDKSYTFIARFVKVSDQTLIINHNKYTGPNALGGGGYYYLTVVRHGKDGSTEKICTRAENTCSLQINPLEDDYFTVTLITHMKGNNQFVNWYRLEGSEYQIVEPEEEVVPDKQEVSYTFDVYVDDIYDNEKLLVNVFNYYSDIASVTADAVLNYKYIDRFGSEKTYTVKLTLDDNYIDTNGYKITEDLIYANAPYIDDLYKDCTWEITDQTYSSVGTTATLKATQAAKPCNVTIKLSDDDIATPVNDIPYNSYLKKGDGSFYTCDDPNFSYWIVYEFGTLKEVAKCFSREFNLKIVDDYDIVAVISDPVDSSMSIGTPTYSREQYTDEAGNKYDYLYADFIVSFMDSKYTLLNSTSDTDAVQYRTGLMVEISQNTKLDPNTSTDYSDITFDSDSDKLMGFATSGQTSTERYAYEGDNRVVYNFAINNADYNNLNRLDYFVKFQNSASMQLYVMKAYYYVYQVDANGDIIPDSYQITEAVYFNLYQIANQSN